MDKPTGLTKNREHFVHTSCDLEDRLAVPDGQPKRVLASIYKMYRAELQNQVAEPQSCWVQNEESQDEASQTAIARRLIDLAKAEIAASELCPLDHPV